MQILRFMSKYIRKHWLLWICGLLIPAFFSTVSNLYFANRLQIYVVQVTRHSASFSNVLNILVLALPVLLLLSFIDNLGLYIISLFYAYTENELKADCYGRLLRTSLKNIQKLSHGEYITRYNTDIENSANLVSYDIFGAVYPMLVGTGYVAAVIYTDFKIGFLMLLLGIMVILLNFVFVQKLKTARTEILQAREVYTSNCNDAIRGKLSIRQYSARELMNGKIRRAAEQLYKRECRAVRLETGKLLTSDALANSCIYLLTPLACVMAAYGYISVPMVLFIHQLCRCFILYTQNFAVAFIHYNEHALSAERIGLILNFEDENKKGAEDRCNIFPNKLNLSFQDINVEYRNRRILQNVSFTAFPGECVAIVGESGSGKSTLVKALLQMIDYQGMISVGGENCRNISLQELRRQISYSPEYNDVFPDMVYNNIRYGNQNASEEEINRAAKKAGITDKESFFMKYTGENGELLSGGQKQKISIARALLKDAPIFIFDEPTAALDADSEAKVCNTILELKRRGKCILLITHKASTLQVADKVVHVKDGKVSIIKMGIIEK